MTWRDYLNPLSCLMKWLHLVISTCVINRFVWSWLCFKKPHLHAFYYRLKQKDPYCAYPFEEMLHISLIAHIHTHKNRRAHTSNEDRNLAVSLLSSVSVWLPTAARRSLKFCLLSRLWIGQHQGLQNTSTKLFLSLCAAFRKHLLLPCIRCSYALFTCIHSFIPCGGAVFWDLWWVDALFLTCWCTFCVSLLALDNSFSMSVKFEIRLWCFGPGQLLD